MPFAIKFNVPFNCFSRDFTSWTSESSTSRWVGGCQAYSYLSPWDVPTLAPRASFCLDSVWNPQTPGSWVLFSWLTSLCWWLNPHLELIPEKGCMGDKISISCKSKSFVILLPHSLINILILYSNLGWKLLHSEFWLLNVDSKNWCHSNWYSFLCNPCLFYNGDFWG